MSVTASQLEAILSQIRVLPFADRNYTIERILMEFESDSELISRIANTLFRITGVDCRAKTRQKDVIIARFIAYHYLYHEEGLTLQEIGQVFGKHHSTILKGIRVVDTWREMNKVFKAENKIYDKLKYLMNNEN